MNQKLSGRRCCNELEAKGICQDVRVALCHAERSEASALRFTNSFDPETLKNRFFVATLLRMTYESKSLIGALGTNSRLVLAERNPGLLLGNLL
jgi:hypothetical protein